MSDVFIYPVRVHIEDTDCTGLVFHSNYLNFMERARSEWIDQLGLTMEWQRQHKIMFVVHSANIQFLKPARAHDRLEVVSSVKSRRRASLIFDQYLRPAQAPDKILSKAEIKIACVDENMRPCAMPELPELALRQIGENERDL
jgi:acyl-CoA thioester hydrolase